MELTGEQSIAYLVIIGALEPGGLDFKFLSAISYTSSLGKFPNLSVPLCTQKKKMIIVLI